MRLYEKPDFARLPAGIERVFEASARRSFFNLPGWYQLIAECGLESGSEASLAVDDRSQVAIACRREPRERTLASCTNMYTIEFDVLGDPSDRAALHALLGELATSVRPLDRIRLEGLDPSSAHFASIIECMRAARLTVRPYSGWANWYEAVAGQGFADYLAARPSILRNTWKRKRAALEKEASAVFRFHRLGDDPEPWIATYEAVRERSWKAAEPFPAFIPGLIRLAAGLGALRLGVLEVDGVPAAAQFWLAWAGRATIFKLVYAEKFATYSPGTLLTMQMMRMVLEEDRPSEIDFGRGDDAYKKLWLSSRRVRFGIEAANPRSLRGLALAGWLHAGLVRDRMKRNAQSAYCA